MKEREVSSEERQIPLGHKTFVTYLFIALVVGGGIALLYYMGGGFTGYAIFNQGNQTEFDQGTYNNTLWNGSAVVLSGSNLSGTYTSAIFDAGADSTWNNLTYTGNSPSLISLFAGDIVANVWKSFNQGAIWSLVKNDYNNGDINGGNDLEKNSTHLFILFNQDLWISRDKGVSWSKINDDYNGGGESQNGDVLGIDNNNYIYIVEGDQDVWRSTNGGSNFSKLASNFNGGNGAVLGLVINSTNAIYAVDIHADVWVSLDQGTSWTLVKDDYNGGVGNSVDDMAIDSSNNLYILDRQDYWRSSDKGVSWTLVNDDVNGAGDSNDAVVSYIDQDNNIYVIDGSEDVLKSNDSGSTFFKVNSTDFNGGGSGNAFGMNSLIEYTNLSFQVKNCSSSDCSDGSWQTVDLNNIDLQGRYFQYKINLTTPDSSKTPFVSNLTVDYSLINQAPSVSVILPQEGNTYGYNESLALNFTAFDGDGNLQSCWYNLDDGSNVSISSCQNTTFSVSGSGSHAINLYANDSLGLLSVDSVSFSIQLGAPTITLNSPIDVYLSSGSNVEFKYIPQDIDLSVCELWGNFTGSWSLNQTQFSPINNSENTFNLDLGDGLYFWNVRCNDSSGNNAFNGNKTFVIDFTNPDISITEPSGTKTSRTNIPLAFSVNDLNVNYCIYNVYRGLTQEISNTSVNCSLGSGSFNVTIDADFVLNFYANDSAGNKDYSSSNFVVDTSTPPQEGGESGGGSSGGGGGGSFGTSIPNLEVGQIQSILVNQGGVKKILSWNVKNKGLSYLNSCKFKSIGEYSSWITKTETKGLAAGEEYTFVFDVNIPENIKEGRYNLGLEVRCSEVNKTSDFDVEIIGKQLDFKLVNVERIDPDKVSVSYTIKDLTGKDQDIELQFLIFNLDNKKEAELNEVKFISASSEQEFTSSIPIKEQLEGELSLLVNLNSETYSSFVQENIVLGKSVSGLAVLGGNVGKNTFISAFLIILFLVFAYFIVRRIRTHKKVKNYKY